MLDAISDGRLDVGFARAFLPHEFRRFGRSPNDSVARFRECIQQVELLLTRESVTHRGRFHAIANVVSVSSMWIGSLSPSRASLAASRSAGSSSQASPVSVENRTS